MEITLNKEVNSPQEIREGILNIEDKMSKTEGAKFGDDACPLKHSFGDGCYIREMSVPKGTLIVGKIHKVKHPYFMLKGKISILTEKGIVTIKAPFSGITLPGTKRLAYVHEDTVWTTVHVTQETDLEKIEEELIAKNFGEVLPTNEEILRLTKGDNEIS